MKRIYFSVIFSISIMILLAAFAKVSFAYPVEINTTKDAINIGMSVEFYEDKASSLSLKDIIKLDNDNKFKTTSKVPLNFGYSPSTYWLSFSVLGETVSESGWILDIPYAPLDYVTLYVPDGKGNYTEYQNGDRVYFENKQIKYKNAAFILGDMLLPYQQYYIKVSSQGSVNLPLTLWTGAGFIEHVNRTQIILGIYFGVLFALIMYNSFLFISTKDRDFILCNFLIISYSFIQATYYGTASQFLWPDQIWWANNCLVLFAVLIFFSTAIFTNSFLKLKEHAKTLYKVMSFFVIYFFIMFFGIFTIGYRLSSIATALMAMALIFSVFISAIIMYARGYKPARFFLLAWTFFLLGMALLLLKLIGILPHVFITEHSVQLGFSINAVLLSFALSDRVNIIRKEKEQAQIAALEHLASSEKMKTKFLHETESLVVERTRELAEANNKLVQQASIDELTGLSNRRVFNEIMEKEFQRAKRSKIEIAVIMLDIDYFKNYNDSYGHMSGDVCLAEIAGILSSRIGRATDTLARYGGEEFVIILNETNLKGALKIAEDMRSIVEAANIPHQSSPYGCVTISCGVMARMPMIQNSFEEFINLADNALSKAKAAGRNCVVASSE